MKIKDFGEFSIIKRIKNRTKSRGAIVGMGDDAAVIGFNKKYYLLWTTDSLIENVHFSRRFSSPKQVGAKAVEQNVSDIAAMGGYPKYMLVSFGFPKNMDLKIFNGLLDGIIERLKKYKIEIIGGNITSSVEIIITITLMGFVEKRYLALRNNAKKGDLVFCTGNLGRSAAGLECLKKGFKHSAAKENLEPRSRLNLSRKIVKIGINSMIDISDGLASEIRHICNASKVGAVIYADKIPISNDTRNAAAKFKKDPLDFALYGGEDYELLFTASKDKMPKLIRSAKVIGEIVDKKMGTNLLKNNKKYKLRLGFDHFKN